MEKESKQYVFIYCEQLQPSKFSLVKCDHKNYVCEDEKCLSYWATFENIYLGSNDITKITKLCKEVGKETVLYNYQRLVLDGFTYKEVRL